MNFSTFVKLFVAALYNETELSGQTAFRISDIIEKYGLSLKPTWRETLFVDHDFSAYVNTERHIGPAEEQQVSLSPYGLRWVEDELGENVAEFLERNGAHYNQSGPGRVVFDPNVFDPNVFDTGDAVVSGETTAVPSFASANWTGISARLSEGERVKLTELSESLIATINQSELDDRSKVTARKHVEAIQTLLEAPDPPWKAIVELLNSPVLIAFLTAIDILRLIWGAAN